MRTEAASSVSIRLYSGVVTALPAAVFFILIAISTRSDYFWKAYLIVGGIFLATSWLLGISIPALVPAHWKAHPGRWIFVQGVLAWLVAILTLGLINLTPLCVGQNNGDGNNDLTLCIVQTMLVAFAYSPLEFTLLCLAALPGGLLLRRWIRSEGL